MKGRPTLCFHDVGHLYWRGGCLEILEKQENTSGKQHEC